MGQSTLDDLRHTNLAHLLAISGLHMGLLSGFVFAAVRLLLNLVPYVALRMPVRKIAAVFALIAAAFYLALSGGNVATERAFVMVAVALVAVLFDRRAISLRGVAIAAMIVLLLRPEALLGPGFQMSFAATTALVAVFSQLRHDRLAFLPRWAMPIAMVALSSAVAGLATAPIAALHFNRIAQFGLLANLISVPVMGTLIMPAAVVAACLAPFGLAEPALWVMGQGLAWVLAVAQEISAWEGAVRAVMTPGPLVLPLLGLGGLILCLWRGRLAVLGALPMAAGFILWSLAERPAVLIAETGGMVGVLTEEGRALSRVKGAGFVVQVWLENDGDLAEQSTAAARWGKRDNGIAQTDLPWGATLWHISGKRARAAFRSCAPEDIAVFNTDAATDMSATPCTALTPRSLRKSGALAYSPDGGRITAQDLTGARLWSGAESR